MVAYLAARTSFFDRVVVRALDGGMTQVVIAGAGTTAARSRYAQARCPVVRDRPSRHPSATSGSGSTGSGSTPSTSRSSPSTSPQTTSPTALATTTHDASAPTLILCEGVAVYLERPVLETLLRGLREIAASRSRFAMSVSMSTDDPELAERRAAFQEAVAAIGEPARTVLTVDGASAFFGGTGWQPVGAPGRQRARRAGFLIAAPV